MPGRGLQLRPGQVRPRPPPYCDPAPALPQPPAAAADLRGGAVPPRPAVLRVRGPVHLLRPGPGLHGGVLPVARM